MEIQAVNKIKKIIIMLLVLAAVVLGLWWVIENSGSAVNSDPNIITAGDHIRGNGNAKVTLIEYGDFQCPACKAFYPLAEQLVQEFGDNLRLVYRNFPLESIHANARAAAIAAEAAAKQNHFWEMYGALYQFQDDWANRGDPTEGFVAYAANIGINSEQFRRDLRDKYLEDKINNDQFLGRRLNVDATPSFFLNNKFIQPQNYDDFKNLVVKAGAQPIVPPDSGNGATLVPAGGQRK